MIQRILASVVIFLSVLFLPFWVSLILALIAMVWLSFFFEAAFLFLISDLLYGAKEEKYFGTVFVSFILAAILVLVVEAAKKKIRFYPKK